MSAKWAEGWGLVSPRDAEFLTRSLSVAIKVWALERDLYKPKGPEQGGPPFRWAEIGIREGHTSRKLYEVLMQTDARGQHEYWAIDSGRDMPVTPPFPGANLIVGDSIDVASQVPEMLDWIFIDGCHCAAHVVSDFVMLVHRRLKVGGKVVFHDYAHPAWAMEHQGHGTPDDYHSIAVQQGLSALGLFPEVVRTDYQLWDKTGEEFVEGNENTGCIEYRRID